MIDREYVAEKVKRIISESSSEADYVKKAAHVVTSLLLDSPQALAWTVYGVYWLNLRDVLIRHVPVSFETLKKCAGDDLIAFGDEDLKKKYDYGSDIANLTAADLYLLQRAASYELTNGYHDVEDVDGTIRPYRTDVGFADQEVE